MKDYANQNPDVLEYVNRTFQPEDRILKEAREHSEAERLPSIQVGSMDGRHIEVIARAIGAKKAVEIGTLGGYSAISIVRGLGPEGKLYSFEADSRHAAVAQSNLDRAGFSEQVEILVGPALENLSQVEKHGPFDLVFIDADKVNYPNYLRWAEKNLRVGGVVLGDNTFAFGMIGDKSFSDPEDEATVKALREFNESVAQSGRFRATILPTGEGLTFAVKIR